MTLSLVGTFPASTINAGFAASPTALTAEIAKLNADITKLGAAITSQATLTSTFPPNLPGYTLAAAVALDPLAIAAAFANIVTLSADANLSLVAELAFIESQITIVAAISADFQAGIAAPGLFGWSYAGRAVGYGTRLQTATRYGFGGIGAGENISAFIIANDTFASWLAFSQGFDVGTSSAENLGTQTTTELLRFLGNRTGADWNSGVRDIAGRIALLLSELRGRKAAIEAQIQITLGVNLPDPGDLVDFGLAIDLDAALDNLAGVQLDISGQVTGLEAEVSVIVDLSADISASLTGGGFSLWSYTGTASGLGEAFAPEVADGLPGVDEPNGAAYGVVIATSSASSWSDFGRIFKTE